MKKFLVEFSLIATYLFIMTVLIIVVIELAKIVFIN